MQLCPIHNASLVGVCIRKECSHQRECCLECIKKLHFSHIQDILDYKEIPQNFEELDQLQSILHKLYTNISSVFEDIIKRINLLKAQQNDFDKSIKLLVFLKAPDFSSFQKHIMEAENELIEQCKKLLIQLEFAEQYPSLKQQKIKLIQSNVSDSSCYLCKSNCPNNFTLSCTHKVCEKCLHCQQNCRLCQSQHTLNVGMKYLKQQSEVQFGISRYNPPMLESQKMFETKQQFQTSKSLQVLKQQNQQKDSIINKEESCKDTGCNKKSEHRDKQVEPQPVLDQSIAHQQVPPQKINEEIPEVEQCFLCKHKFALRDMFENSFCDHFYCFSCLDGINQKGKIKIVCPIPSCQNYFDIEKFENYYLNYQEMLLDTWKNQQDQQLMQI